tara:strand:- start:562 stop:831 length:270 start_codon:yes stop_codon:yes gene_type:complete
MKIINLFNTISNSLKYKKDVRNLHRWGNHITPQSDCYQRMENCMAMKYYDYHNTPSFNERIVDKTKTIQDELRNVSNPDVVMMRMTMIF